MFFHQGVQPRPGGASSLSYLYPHNSNHVIRPKSKIYQHNVSLALVVHLRMATTGLALM
jgi:hypothetical protein